MPKGCYPRKSRFYPIEPDSPIDDKLTQERLGYAATTVSPGSTDKKVTFLCARCNEPVDRIRYRVKPGTLCRSCAHAKDGAPVKHPLKSGYEKVEVPCAGCGKTIKVRKMSLHEGSSCPACRRKSKVVPNKYIDAEETKRRFGYDGAKVTVKSHDKVVVRCSQCAAVFERVRRNVTEEPVCVGCSQGKNKVVHSCIDDEETLKRFGYRGSELAEKAKRMVVFRCARCGTFVEKERCNVHETSWCAACKYPALNKYIEVEKTEVAFGYDPNTLARQSNKQVLVRCADCGEIFSRIFHNVKEKPLCQKCLYPPEDHPALDDEETEKRFGYKASEVPSRSARKVVGQCVLCGEHFERCRYNVSEEPGCCKNHQFGVTERDIRSRLEKQLGRPLDSHYLLPTGKEVDIYDASSKIGVEYCGLYWHNELSPNPRTRTYHYNKYTSCHMYGIDLITVFEDEWLQRPDAVLDVLAARMGAYNRTIGARKCRVTKISGEIAAYFLETRHVQGAPPPSWATWGLYFVDNEGEDELVAVMTFGQHHRQGHKDVAVLTRLCYASGTRIVGGAQRLFKAALPELRARGCSRIVSWSDNRWFSGRVYEKLGFTLEEHIPPDYSYVNQKKPRERLSKQSQRKKVTGCPEGMTEREWALERGLVRIWDCGRKRWVLPL